MTPRIFLWILLCSAAAQDMEEEGEVETNQTDVRGDRLVVVDVLVLIAEC